MDNIRQIILQEENEKRYSRAHIDGYIRDYLAGSAEAQAKIAQGVQLVNEYMGKSYYASKNARIAQLSGLDIGDLVTDILVGVAYCLKEELFTSVTAQLAGRLGFDDKPAAIVTVAEIVAVVCMTDAYDICKASRGASLVIVNKLPLPPELLRFIQDSEYLPPMVCEPLELTSNRSSGYLGHKDSLILRNGNHHEGNICLDVLNTVNKVKLKLDTEFLCKVEEEPTFDLDTPEKVAQWQEFKRQSYNFYSLMNSQGNEFYLCSKVDKRGRIYSLGYHINTQGTSFKKAMIELANEEIVTGVP